ncbi:PREDICTED: cyclic nucleotide-gated [Prunus dulcis]|uniref:PREDICTED: cyclic nucleotide-gated n=1 Tax=Prunus dulcis TaxID=3755 RepID=A0A5E4F588_PRUDU|nr:PREDICTED: cyclic nucleotide-gated [Prunus dulcis]
MERSNQEPSDSQKMAKKQIAEIASRKPPVKWDTELVILFYILSVSLDPLLFYGLILNDERKCVVVDTKLEKIAIVLRSLADLSYIWSIIRDIGGIAEIIVALMTRPAVFRSISMAILAVLPVPQVFGAFWYFFSIQREIACWGHACQSGNGCEFRIFDCDDGTLRNVTLLNDFCSVNPSSAKLFDFGIYLDAVQSGMLRSTNFRRKVMQCFSWGVRNLRFGL